MAPKWFSKDRRSFFDGGGEGAANKSSPAVVVFLERLLLRPATLLSLEETETAFILVALSS